MTAAELQVVVCGSCGQVAFPPPLLCPRCGAQDWTEEPAGTGVAEQLTELRRVAGSELEQPVRLAAVRLARGPAVIARAAPDVAAGATVRIRLDPEDGAPCAEPAP
jgi:uncharacterized OB-fold protein